MPLEVIGDPSSHMPAADHLPPFVISFFHASSNASSNAVMLVANSFTIARYFSSYNNAISLVSLMRPFSLSEASLIRHCQCPPGPTHFSQFALKRVLKYSLSH